MTMADGHACTKSLTHTNDLDLVLPDLHERMMFTVFPLAKNDAILGKPWLTKNNPSTQPMRLRLGLAVRGRFVTPLVLFPRMMFSSTLFPGNRLDMPYGRARKDF